MNKNKFGGLVKAYREQRGWTQNELAERWGYDRSYISQIERGQRKLDNTSQVVKLADILDIPQEKLEEIGRGIPERKKRKQSPSHQDDAILQMLLAPGKEMVRLSWLAWYADAVPNIEANLHSLVSNLDQALTSYNGEFINPAQQLLAYTHQMLGKISFDRLDFSSASGHFSKMIDLGQELNDADIITTGMVQQGSIFRKRNRFSQSFRCFEAARPYADVASENVQGMRLLLISRAGYDSGNEAVFLDAIHKALDLASWVETDISSLANDFSLDGVLQEQASGYSELWKPEDALKVYQETDKLRPFRPLRDQGAYTINKAQAALKVDREEGLSLALQGIKYVQSYKSKRHIGWLDKTYNQIRERTNGPDRRLSELREALTSLRKDMDDW